MNSKHLLAAVGIASALLAALPGTSFGGEEPVAAAPAAKPDVVTLKDKGYILTVRTPEGWQADTETAKKYRASVLYTQEAGAGAKITLAVQRKLDENTALSISGEIASIRKQYPNVELADLDVKHPKYATFTKTIYLPGQFFQYEAYVNPGSLYSNTVYVGMSKAKEPATPAELAAFQEIVQSLQMELPPEPPR